MVVLDRFFFHLGDKVVAGHVRQVVFLYSIDFMGVYVGGLSTGCPKGGHLNRFDCTLYTLQCLINKF